MADPVLDALATRAQSGDSAPSADPVMAALSERASGKSFTAPTVVDTPATRASGALQDIGRGIVGLAENIIPGVEALYAEPAAWLSKRGTEYANALGLTQRTPEEVGESVRNFLTLSPQTEVGKAIQGRIGRVMAPVANSAQFYANKLESIPAVGPAALETTEGLLALAPGAATVREAASPVRAAAMAERAAERATAVARTGYERESMGAAAAAHNLDNVSPPVRQAIIDAAQEGSLNRQVVTRHLESDTLPIPIKLTKGQATQDPVQISLEQNARGKNPELAATFAEQNGALIENMDEIRRSVAPQVVGNDHIQNGQALIDAYKAADEPIRADIRAKYKALEEANGGDFPIDATAFVESADALLKKKLKTRQLPGDIAGDLAEFREAGKMTFDDFENLRTSLAKAERKADISGDGNAAMAVSLVREALEDLPLTGEAANLKPLADAARAAAKARFDKLRADPAYRAAADDSVAIGELSPLADDFVNKYVVKGKKANIQQMRENLANDPVAVETIGAGALNYLKSKSGVNLFTNEGNFSQAGYNRALQELTPKLPELVSPEVADQLQALGNVARYTQAQPRGAFVNNSNTFVAAAAEHAKGIMEGGLNFAAHGVPVGTFVRKKVDARKERKFVEEALAPASGVKLKDLPK